MKCAVVSTTLADKAGVMVYDGDILVHVAGFTSVRAAQVNESHVLAFVRDYYEIQALTTKIYQVLK